MSPKRIQEREVRRIKVRALHNRINKQKDKTFSRLIEDLNKDYHSKKRFSNSPRLV